jgi:hypothetical protein
MRNPSFARLSLLAVLLLVGAGCFQKPAPAPAPAPTPAPAPQAQQPGPSTATRIAGNAIIVGDQKPGSSIMVTLAANDKPAFLVVREGKTAASTKLGVSDLLPAGESSAFSIALSRNSKDGETLYVASYADSNGNAKFDATDAPLKDSMGNDLWASVIISVNASEGPNPATL